MPEDDSKTELSNRTNGIRSCRICLGGPEDEADLGRLISPCLCSGSMRYVHVQCMNEWRGTGTNAKAFHECQQCHYKYRLSRTWITNLNTPLLIHTTSTLLLLLITYLLGRTYLHILKSTSILPFPPPSLIPRIWTPHPGYHFRFAPLSKHLADQPWHDTGSKDWYIEISSMGIGLYDLILATNVATVEFLAFIQNTYPSIPFNLLASEVLGSSLIGSFVFLINAIQHPLAVVLHIGLSAYMPFKGGFLSWLRQGVASLTFIHSMRNPQDGSRLTEEALPIIRGEYWAAARLGLVGLVITLGIVWGMRSMRRVVERWVRWGEMKLERSILEVEGADIEDKKDR